MKPTTLPINTAEQRTLNFYNTVGWVTTDSVTEDALRYEDLRVGAREYVSKCRLRVTRHVGSGNRMLDMASGPIQYEEYLSYSAAYQTRHCVDLSGDALREAERKLGSHGVYLYGSFFDLEIPENYFDCAISLHTIYHMDKDAQESAVRKLLRVTKPGRPVIIVYSNPRSLSEYVRAVIHKAGQIFVRRQPEPEGSAAGLYFYPHRLEWFDRFRDVAELTVLPWRSFTATDQRTIIPDNWLGRWLLARLFDLEEKFPRFFVRFGQYPMIILTKR